MPSKMRVPSAILSLLLLGLPFPERHLHAQVDALDDLHASHQLAGMSVVTRCGDEVTLEHHSGWRDLELGWPVDGATKYRVASISKAVVALVAAKLAEEGLLDHDAPIGQYLEDPPFHPAHPDIPVTFRHLMTHTSGIRDGSGYSDFLSDTYSEIPDVPLLSSVLGEGGPYYTTNMWGSPAPGTWFQYANLNFGVAATVMEAATGTRFDLLVREMLLDPYGLDAGFKVQDLDDIAQLAVLYRQVNGAWVPQVDHHEGVMPPGPDWDGYAPGTNAVGFAPQGGLRISARDLSVLARVWSHGAATDAEGNPLTFLGADALAELHAVQWSFDSGSPNGNNYYGLFNQWSNGLHLAASGLGEDEVIPDAGVAPFIGHPGEAYGLISDAYATPDGQWNAVFITSGKWNGYTQGAASAYYAVEQEVFAILRDDLLQCTASATAAEVQPDWTVIGVPRPGDTLIHLLTPGASGPLRFRWLDGSGRLLASGETMPGVPGRMSLRVPAMARGAHLLQLTGTGGQRRLLVYVAG